MEAGHLESKTGVIIGENKTVDEENTEKVNCSTNNAPHDVSISTSHATKDDSLNSTDDATQNQVFSTYSESETREGNNYPEEKKVECTGNSKSASESSVSIAGRFFMKVRTGYHHFMPISLQPHTQKALTKFI